MIESKTETLIGHDARGIAATLEVGTIVHEGRAFTAQGALVSDDRLVCYLSGADSFIGARGEARTWNGARLGTYEITGRWEARFFGRRSWMASHYHSVRITLQDGREYVGRGFGNGMVCFARRARRAS